MPKVDESLYLQSKFPYWF